MKKQQVPLSVAVYYVKQQWATTASSSIHRLHEEQRQVRTASLTYQVVVYYLECEIKVQKSTWEKPTAHTQGKCQYWNRKRYALHILSRAKSCRLARNKSLTPQKLFHTVFNSLLTFTDLQSSKKSHFALLGRHRNTQKL